MFPGCTYMLTLQPEQPCTGGIDQEYRVVVDRDGTVIDTADEGMIARWYFPGMSPFPVAGDTLWPTGNEVLLLFENSHKQLRSVVSAPGGDAACELKISSLDGGRTWRHVATHGQAQEKVSPNTHGVAAADDRVLLTLVIPSAVSMFPLTSAMRPVESYLNGASARKLSLGEIRAFATDNRKLEPIVQVFEAQPFRYGGNHGGTAEFQALVVISRAVPRPIERKEDLACVVNGLVTRAVWLSWSMVLCSSAHVMREEATLSVTFRSERFSSEVTFRRAPPPRHVFLAWPAVESFDFLPRGDAQIQSRHSPQLPSRNATKLGVPGIRPFRTTVALCTMFKNEARYLGEWLRYHKQLGVSKVYMYDNGSSDESREILEKFERSQLVEVRDWPHQGAQTEALNDCLSRFRHKTRWISFIDVDEFIDPAPSLPVADSGDLVETSFGRPDALRAKLHGSMAARNKRLSHLLEGWAPDRHTHCMAWINYCSFGQISKPEGGVLENYVDIEDTGERKIHMQKPLFKALEALTLRRIGPHFLLFATEDIDEQYSRNLKCPYEWLDPGEFRIRHYRSKSLEEYVQRRTGADSAYKTKRYTKEQLESEWRQMNARCGQERE